MAGIPVRGTLSAVPLHPLDVRQIRGGKLWEEVGTTKEEQHTESIADAREND
jgi:hypothetical protein